MTKSDHLIWSNWHLDYEDQREYYEEAYPELSEDERMRLMYEDNDMNLDDERANLNIQLGQPILVVADLGLWDGRRVGFREIESGNIRDCLSDGCDYCTWFVDRLGDLRCDAIHHDGQNHYLYRVRKEGVSDEQLENLKWKLHCGKATRADLNRLTRRLGDEIGRVYGWEFPVRTQRQTVEIER